MPIAHSRQRMLTPLHGKIVVAVCGVIVGCKGPTSIERWAKAKKDWLAALLELPKGIPSRDCIRRILSALKPEALSLRAAASVRPGLSGTGLRFRSDSPTRLGTGFTLAPSVSQPVPLRAESIKQPSSLGRIEQSETTTNADTRRAASVSDRSIGRFKIGELLGSGSFGKVYRAFDTQLQRDVALKTPQPGLLEQPKAVERFLREARAAAQLRHSNIVPVYDAGEQDGEYYAAGGDKLRFLGGRSSC